MKWPKKKLLIEGGLLVYHWFYPNCRVTLRLVIVSTSFIILLLCTSFNVQSSTYGNIYDMDVFLSEPHPFDIQNNVTKNFSDNGQAPVENVSNILDEDLDRAVQSHMEDTLLSSTDSFFVNDDPLEPMNRAIFGFNSYLNSFLLSPLAQGYNKAVPDFARASIGSFLNNLSSPVVLANDLMQLEFARAYGTFERLLINSTIGIFGFWDAAAWMGIPSHKEDFGQTLGAYGVGEGMYLVLPVLGPTNPRDILGQFIVDPFLDPVGMWLINGGRDTLQWTRTGLSGFTSYAQVVDELITLEETSLDYYSAIRSFYRQKRNSEILNLSGSVSKLEAVGGVEIIDFDDM